MKKDEILNYLQEFKNSSNNKLFTEIGLFGSYAKDKADEFSDIDVAVRINKDYLEKHDIWDYFDAIKEIQDSILKRFSLKSDIFDLDSAGSFSKNIREEIIYV